MGLLLLMKNKDLNKNVTVQNEAVWFLLTVSFIEGGAVMAVELLGAKMIEPYFGSSLYVWSAVLAITLLGLTSGYYSGGILSEKNQQPGLLYYLLAVAAFLTGLMPITGTTVFASLLSIDFRFGAIIAACVLLLPSLCIFGMVSPIIIRRLSTKAEHAGKKAGLVYAISTVGGILFTFLTGFYLIPEIGVRISAVFVALLLLIMPLIYFFSRKQIIQVLIVALIGIFIGFFNHRSHVIPSAKSQFFKQIYRSEGLLGNISVYDYLKEGTRCLFVNNVSQSFMHVPSGRSQWRYVHRLALYSCFKPAGSKVFLVGLGAGNVVNELNILGFDVTVCDIDRRMEYIARNFFGMSRQVKVIIDDARHAIRTAKEKYDIVILDVSAGENQPDNLYTIESFGDLKSMLQPDGVLFVHYPTVYRAEDSKAFSSIWKTLEIAGFNTEVINTQPNYDAISEFILYATLDGTSLRSRDFGRRDTFAVPFKFPLGNNIVIDTLSNSNGFLLTDDKPVFSKLHRPFGRRNRQAAIDVTLKGLLHEKMVMF